jgi:alpha,alpha-trehalose phosphorylase
VRPVTMPIPAGVPAGPAPAQPHGRAPLRRAVH